PNGKRTCIPMNDTQQFASFGALSHNGSAPLTPNDGRVESHGFLAQNWSQSNPSSLLRTAVTSNNCFNNSNNNNNGNHYHPQGMQTMNGYTTVTTTTTMNGYHTPESVHSSSDAVSPFSATSMDMEMESVSATQDSPAMVQNTNAMLNSAISSSMMNQQSALLPSALPGQGQGQQQSNEFVPVHGRSMEIPSYARVPADEARKFREQRWSSCIYGADTRIGQGMMI
ncbi:hypothetical protein BGZ98_004804, partial [Dissophora globulifera]